jgi:hypothetical protein
MIARTLRSQITKNRENKLSVWTLMRFRAHPRI